MCSFIFIDIDGCSSKRYKTVQVDRSTSTILRRLEEAAKDAAQNPWSCAI